MCGSHDSGSQGNSLLGYLKSEVHVGTLCVGVGVLVTWCGVIGEGEEVPSSLIEHIKVGEELHVFSGECSTCSPHTSLLSLSLLLVHLFQ